MTDRVESKLDYFSWHNGDQTTWGEIRELVVGCESVLDVGAGNGWLTRRIHEAGVRDVVGCDVDTAVLSLNEPSNDSVRGVIASAEKLPFNDGTFDLVVAKDIIEHLLYPGDAVSEFARVLREGGKLYVATPSVQSKNFFNDYTHIRPFSDKSLQSLLADNGLIADKIYYTGNYPGVGRWMSFRESDHLPSLVYSLARLGFRRNNIHAVARKVPTQATLGDNDPLI